MRNFSAGAFDSAHTCFLFYCYINESPCALFDANHLWYKRDINKYKQMYICLYIYIYCCSVYNYRYAYVYACMYVCRPNAIYNISLRNFSALHNSCGRVEQLSHRRYIKSRAQDQVVVYNYVTIYIRTYICTMHIYKYIYIRLYTYVRASYGETNFCCKLKTYLFQRILVAPNGCPTSMCTS